jgi:cysteine desulfurase/selenocysteine lyase
MSDSLPNGLDPLLIRQDFPILERTVADHQPLVYLDNAASTQRPRQVTAAMVDLDESCYANVHRGLHTLSEEMTDRFEQAREQVADFISSPSSDQIVFTSGTTAAINLVARGWGDQQLQPGDEILLTLLEHHSNIVPWQQLAERSGAVIRWVEVTPSGQLDMDSLADQLGPRTRLLAITAVSNVLGTVTPLAEVIQAAHDQQALVLVDAAQMAPHMPLNVAQLDADFIAFSGHKMLGPNGVGVLYGRQELLESMSPVQGGGGMIHSVSREGFEPSPVPTRFEAGTPPISQVLGLAAAMQYLENVGLQAIHQHEQQLVQAACQQLAEIPALTLLGPGPDQTAGIVSFVVQGVHPHDLAQALDRQGVAIRAGHHCAMPLHQQLGISASCRASFYLYNTLDEVSQLASAIRRGCDVFLGS